MFKDETFIVKPEDIIAENDKSKVSLLDCAKVLYHFFITRYRPSGKIPKPTRSDLPAIRSPLRKSRIALSASNTLR
jgi:hypothetical protein